MVNKVSFQKSLEPSHGVLQLLKNFYSVLILHLLRPLFSVFQSLGIFLVNDLYIGDPLANMLISVRLC